MMQTTVGMAVFGVGRAGQYHLTSMAAHPDVTVRWVVDVEGVRERAAQLCAQYGLQDTHFAPTDHWQCVLDDPQTVAVVVTTPTRFHEDITKRALRAGKHVFCEKPISFTAEVVQSCYQEAEKHGRVLFCGFNKRFDEQHVKLRERVQAGQLGSPRLVHYHWRDPKTSPDTVASYILPSGGIFCDSAIHQLDYVPWMLGETPSTVHAVGTRTSLLAGDYAKCGDVDSTIITLGFPSGVHAIIEVSREMHNDDLYFRIEVMGTKDTYLLHKVNRDTTSEVRMDGQKGETLIPLTIWSAYKHEMDCFVRVVQGKEECPVTAQEAIQASRLADLCLLSLNEDRVVIYEEI
ncbi:myo-inositol 2-dehydrogenase-like [Littorina saxatilis]|uniref:Uncharacterized protein n=1 Tax=Littorina saxatilis TaxID=31220 RepID=A0AAN9BBZ6_9CAEN